MNTGSSIITWGGLLLVYPRPIAFKVTPETSPFVSVTVANAVDPIPVVVPEPIGGAHRDPISSINNLGDVLEKRLKELSGFSKEELIKLKEKKYLEIG